MLVASTPPLASLVSGTKTEERKRGKEMRTKWERGKSTLHSIMYLFGLSVKLEIDAWG